MSTNTGQEPGVSAPAPGQTKTIATLRAQFALRGHVLAVTRNIDGRKIYTIAKWGQSRTFTLQHDVIACFTQIGGAA